MLPIGSFTWSQGLETAAERGWIHDGPSAYDWIAAQLEHSLSNTEGAFLRRLYAAFVADDDERLAHWNNWLFACRETKELLEEDQEQGELLHKLNRLHYAGLQTRFEHYSFCAAFAEALSAGGIEIAPGIEAFLWMWVESQTIHTIKLIPLGLQDGQILLDRLLQKIPAACARSLSCPDSELGWSLFGRSLASSWHETQYCRIYRS